MFIEIRAVDQDSGLHKLGASRYELMKKNEGKESKEGIREDVMVLFNNLWEDNKRRKQIQEMTQSQLKRGNSMVSKADAL